MKTKIIPFDVKIAKDIQDGKIEGKIKTRDLKYECSIVDYGVNTGYTATEDLLLIKFPAHDFEEEKLKVYHYDGRYMDNKYGDNWFDIILEISDNEPQFKPFDKILVREDDLTRWQAAFFSHIESFDGERFAITTSGDNYNLANNEIIPYEGNEHLVGTTDNPKKD